MRFVDCTFIRISSLGANPDSTFEILTMSRTRYRRTFCDNNVVHARPVASASGSKDWLTITKKTTMGVRADCSFLCPRKTVSSVKTLASTRQNANTNTKSALAPNSTSNHAHITMARVKTIDHERSETRLHHPKRFFLSLIQFARNFLLYVTNAVEMSAGADEELIVGGGW